MCIDFSVIELLALIDIINELSPIDLVINKLKFLLVTSSINWP